MYASSKMIKPTTLIKIILLVLVSSGASALACLRSAADKRAVQWSDAIIHAKLQGISDSDKDGYSFIVTDVLDGSVTPGQKLAVRNFTPSGAAPSCGGHLTAEDVGKNFLLLLRSSANDSYVIVNISPADNVDSTAVDAFKQLVQETRKAEASLTTDQAKTQAMAYANAQDETEADQAEETLRQMGYKAVPAIKDVMSTSTEIGKQRLETLIHELTPPAEAEPTTQP